jgi:putative oxidoreductase
MTPSTSTQNTLTLVGRALIALLFIPAGFGKIGGFAGTVGYISSVGVPLPEAAAAIAILVELGLGLMLLVGFQARWAALGMAVFTLVITFVFHHYWDVPAAQVMMQKLNFFKNLAIIGGLFGIVAWGPGGWSIDGRRDQR